MILPSDANDHSPSEEPLGKEDDTLLALRKHFFELQDAQSEFEALWYTTGRGELLPDVQDLERVLGAIAGRVELIGQAFGSLRIQREHGGEHGEDDPHSSSEPERPR